jgi:hypothetical protein
MTDGGLLAALAGTALSPEDWYRFLNQRVFFWLTEERLFRMLAARSYRNEAHTVLVLDTRALVRDHLAHVKLSSLNSGATRPYPWPRDFEIFKPLAEYPFAALRRRRAAQNVVVELAVDYSVTNIADYVLEVRRMKGSEVLGLVAGPR